MATYSIQMNDALVTEAKRTFSTQTAITSWMKQQVERLLRQIVVPKSEEKTAFRELTVSDRIKALSAVPPSTSHSDYKDEIEEIMSNRY